MMIMQPMDYVNFKYTDRTVDDFLVLLIFDALPYRCHGRVLIG
jgi:hypothetical protein